MTDISIMYVVTPMHQGTQTDVSGTISAIIHYVQNNEVYFQLPPQFMHDVLICSIVGAALDHTTFQKTINAEINQFGCHIQEVL